MSNEHLKEENQNVRPNEILRKQNSPIEIVHDDANIVEDEEDVMNRIRKLIKKDKSKSIHKKFVHS